jgi:RNA polymerase sigma-70 factor (ECF subfamily)
MIWTVGCYSNAVAFSLDSELVANGRNGDRQAFSELFERHYSSSMRVARHILRSEEDASDAVQSAYLAAFEHFEQFRGDAQFYTWITRIVKNECIMCFRRADRRRVISDVGDGAISDALFAIPDDEPSPEDVLLQREVTTAHLNAARKLPKRLRDVYTMCCVSGLPVRDAAETLGLTVPAAKTRLFRAQHRVRAEMRKRLVGRGQGSMAGALFPPPVSSHHVKTAA